jgi:large subunit ribosomal protein L4
MQQNNTIMQATIYSKDGTQKGTLTLPEGVFNVPWNADLVHQAVVAMQANARTTVAHTKSRSEVRGGGKKPWKQKGTGRARHGSSRSPIWRKGGVSHGPRNERVFEKTLSKKMRAKAFLVALSQKFKDGEILFVDDLSFAAPKAKEAKATLTAFAKLNGFEKLATKRVNAALIAVPENAQTAKLSFRNFGNVAVEETRNLNVVDLLSHKYLIVSAPEAAVSILGGKTTVKKKTA